MIQTFIRAGGRQFTVLTCAVVALGATRIASAEPMADLRSEAIAMGVDPDATPVNAIRRAAPKRSGTVIWDNGDPNGVNGLASELNTLVTDARTADDFDFTNALTSVDHATARLYVSGPNNGRLEIYRNHLPGGPCSPARPFTGNPPIYVFTTTDGILTGVGFGYEIREYQWQTPGMTFTAGKYWLVPIQVGTGSGRGFFAFSASPHVKGCASCFRSTYFGVPEWTSVYAGLDFDSAFRLYGTAGGGGGGGTCDLTPIEEKLDDETRFTDDDELQALSDQVALLASQASVDALEAKADAMQLQLDQLQNTLCDIVRLLTTPNGQRTATCNGVDYEWNGLQGGGGGD